MSLLQSITPEKLQSLLEDLPLSDASVWQALAIAVGSYLTLQVGKFLKIAIIGPAFSPLRFLPGPPRSEAGMMWGHLAKVFDAPPNEQHEKWFEEYGPVITYRGMLGSRRLCTKDPRALSHMLLSNAYDFPKPDIIRGTLIRVFGNGILFAEGDSHKRQRKIMNPCFGPAQVRDLMPIFWDTGAELTDVWQQVLQDTSSGKVMDVMPLLTRTTLDVIGSAGFDYSFNSMRNGEKNELVRAFMDLFAPSQSRPLLGFLAQRFTILQLIPTKRAKIVKHSREVMRRIGNKLVQDKKAAVQAAAVDGLEKKVVGRDLLTVLVQANMASNLKDSERLTDDEVMGQISTMLIAGHETTSTSLTWLLYSLAQPKNAEIQSKLREELTAVNSSQPSMDELNALPYLDAVVRENMRINTVVDSTIRCAGKDDIIPLSQPYIDSSGIERREIRVAKGDQIFIPILAVNRDKAIWGEDAREFKPERWLEPGNHPNAAEIPGVFSNVLSFLGGPRACIGYRMALAEMKVLIFVIIRNFKFSLPDGAESLDVIKKSNIVTRPVMKQPDGTLKAMMPLLVESIGTA